MATCSSLALAEPAKKPDFAAMIECRTDFGDYQSFALGDFQDEAYKKRLGIKLVKQANFMLLEYALPRPISVHGYRTSRIVFNSAGIMAVLDETDAAALAERLKLEVVVNSGAKILATRTLLESPPETLGGMKVWRKVSMDLSTVPSHPGKTLVGCTYRPMMEE
ncbi:MAG: hypothetical protein WAV95_01895 [Azonexus sp.]